MTALYIILAIFGVLLLLLHARVYITFAYRSVGDAELSLHLSYLFIKLPLIPKKEKKIRLRDFSYKNMEKKKKKEAAKASRKTQKKADAKKASKKSGKASNNTDGTPKKKEKSIVSVIYEIRALIFDAIKRFPSKFRLDINRLHIYVGGEDAAAAAITYGVVTEAVGALLALLESNLNLRRGREHDIMITPDFHSGKIDADLRIRLSIKPASVLAIAFRFIKGLAAHKLSSLTRKK